MKFYKNISCVIFPHETLLITKVSVNFLLKMYLKYKDTLIKIILENSMYKILARINFGYFRKKSVLYEKNHSEFGWLIVGFIWRKSHIWSCCTTCMVIVNAKTCVKYKTGEFFQISHCLFNSSTKRRKQTNSHKNALLMISNKYHTNAK